MVIFFLGRIFFGRYSVASFWLDGIGNMQQLGVGVILALTLALSACQPKDAPRPSDPKPQAPKVVLVDSQAMEVKLARNEVCTEKGCTRYDMQSVQTNLPWIDDYFVTRLAELEPEAFNTDGEVFVPDVNDEKVVLEYNNQFVHYIGQRKNIAMFAIQSYSYGGKLAQSTSHQEYINFDLNFEKRLSLKDILNKGQELALLKLVYDKNYAWLKHRNIELEQLKLSDNFYFSAKGLSLVYPVYELGSYADGMTELTVPYTLLAKILKAEYLPSLPNYAKVQK